MRDLIAEHNTATRIATLFELGEAVITWSVDPRLNAVEPGSPVAAIWSTRWVENLEVGRWWYQS